MIALAPRHMLQRLAWLRIVTSGAVHEAAAATRHGLGLDQTGLR